MRDREKYFTLKAFHGPNKDGKNPVLDLVVRSVFEQTYEEINSFIKYT